MRAFLGVKISCLKFLRKSFSQLSKSAKFAKILCVFLLCGSCLCEAEQKNSSVKFAAEVKSLYANSSDKKVVGRLLPTTAVEVLTKEGSMLKIRVKGWSEPGSVVALYAVPNRRILNVGLSRDAKIPFTKISSKNFEGKVFDELAGEFYTEDSGFSDALEPLFKEANELYTTNCSMCHALHPLNQYKANQWSSLIKSMLSRTAITKDKSQLVIQFVQKNASDIEK